MGTVVNLKFCNGDFQQGFEKITVSVADSQKSTKLETTFQAAPEVPVLYQNWKNEYLNLANPLIARIRRKKIIKFSWDECFQKCENIAQELVEKLNQWLWDIKSSLESGFKLNPESEVIFVIYTQDVKSQYVRDILHRLPWQEWDYFRGKYFLEAALFLNEYEGEEIRINNHEIFRRVRITSIFGDSSNIDIAPDKNLISRLQKRGAELINLEEPQRQDFIKLWDEPCDILFYSGHSESDNDGTVGSLQINNRESLNLQEIRNTFSEAIRKGLKLAIFNSCDGLGLAQQLADLHLPYIIVWREPVPDKIAQMFLEYFLRKIQKINCPTVGVALSSDTTTRLGFARKFCETVGQFITCKSLSSYAYGKSLFNSVRDAKIKLVELTGNAEKEKQIPGLNWLPIICQNTTYAPPAWEDLGGLTGKLPECPYQGLSAFGEENKDFFFGRDVVIEGLVEAVKSKPLVPIIGASGSGKSSVVFAGLVPKLKEIDNVEIIFFRPGKNPFDSLATALISHYQHQLKKQGKKKAGLKINLDNNPQELSNVIKSIVNHLSLQRYVLIIDQLEEIYTLTNSQERQVFLDSLVYTVEHASLFSLVLMLRADFMGKALDYQPMGEILQKYPPILLTQMKPFELRAAIEKPAHKMKVELEQGLTSKLIDDLGNQPGRLPLLEFTLSLLWEKPNKWYLTHTAYEEIGGLEKALAKYASEVLNPLSTKDKEKAERIFIQLISPGEGTEDTKRKATRSSVGEENWDLVEFLANKRLVVTGWDESSQQETVEIIHEALIREWGTLGQWIQSNRQFRIWQERLQFLVLAWEGRSCEPEYCLSGGALGEAEGWLNDEKYQQYLSDSQKEFILLSLQVRNKEQQEKVRLQKRAITWLSGGLVAASLATGFAGWNWVKAERNATISQIDGLRVNSEFLLGLQQYEDALIEAIKGYELLKKNLVERIYSNSY